MARVRCQPGIDDFRLLAYGKQDRVFDILHPSASWQTASETRCKTGPEERGCGRDCVTIEAHLERFEGFKTLSGGGTTMQSCTEGALHLVFLHSWAILALTVHVSGVSCMCR